MIILCLHFSQRSRLTAVLLSVSTPLPVTATLSDVSQRFLLPVNALCCHSTLITATQHSLLSANVLCLRHLALNPFLADREFLTDINLIVLLRGEKMLEIVRRMWEKQKTKQRINEMKWGWMMNRRSKLELRKRKRKTKREEIKRIHIKGKRKS